ncbi:MAG: GNAT family N-acetyltransferase [Actinomycetota bacterium]
MDVAIRLGHHGDVESITSWTSDTFSWGDYIPERLPHWLDDPDGEVLVAIDESDTPMAMCHVAMLSPTEGWLEGARVHPERRRFGLGKRLNEAGVEWVRERGGRVVRLATEASNMAARNQVRQLGYREVSRWLFAEFDVDPTHRTSERYRMRPAPGSDAEAAWLFWAGSDLARKSRELIALGWRWRTARPSDVTGVAGPLVQSSAGWAIVEQPDEDSMRTNWIASTPEDMLGLIDGLLDFAAEREVSELNIKLPDLPWTAEAIRRSGDEPKPVIVHAKAV